MVGVDDGGLYDCMIVFVGICLTVVDARRLDFIAAFWCGGE